MLLSPCANPDSAVRMQAAAKQVLGREEVVFPELYKSVGIYGKAEPDVAATWMHLLEPGHEIRWNPAYGKNQFWFDALTVDPSKLLTDQRGLWEHGVAQPVVATKMENANIGTLPKILVYIAVHQEFGTHIWFPYHGARHGTQDRESEGTMYEGFEYWDSNMSEEKLKEIILLHYCNTPESLKKFEKKASQERKDGMKELTEDGKSDRTYYHVRFSSSMPAGSGQAVTHAHAPYNHSDPSLFWTCLPPAHAATQHPVLQSILLLSAVAAGLRSRQQPA